MQAIILCAGMGRRLKELTNDRTKCMVDVNGKKLIDRTLESLTNLSLNLSRIVIVTGYKGDELESYINLSYKGSIPIHYVRNKKYDKTNNIVSLQLALKKFDDDDTILLESDVIFDQSILDDLVNCTESNVALVDRYESWMDGTVTVLSHETDQGEVSKISDIIFKKDFKYNEADRYYKTVNIYKFSKEYIKGVYKPFLDAYVKTNPNSYYEEVIKVVLGLKGHPLYALVVKSGKMWYEIDDVQDLNIASIMFSNSSMERYKKLCKCYGGYWRYPHLHDYCYLVNPYYPPKEFYEEMKYNFQRLSSQYPSGSRIAEELVGKDFDLDPNTVVVGNGLSEIIPHLIKSLPKGHIGIQFPTFEEYSNQIIRQRPDDLYKIGHDLNNEHDNALMTAIKSGDVKSVIFINPDNPTGITYDKPLVLELVEICKEKKVILVVDESFIDFACGDESIMDKEFLSENPHVVVCKSISKSHGVPGLRLGYIVTYNKKLRKNIKDCMPIWNINSFGEFYLQIFSKYEKDFSDACYKLYQSRSRFSEWLSRIPTVSKVYPSLANFILIKLRSNFNSDKIAASLLDSGFFVKSCSNKSGLDSQYLRLAVRTDEENFELVKALHHEYKTRNI